MQRLGHLLVATMMLSGSVAAGWAAEEPIALWPNEAPGETGAIGPEQEQPKRPGDDTIRIANVTRPTLEVFLAPAEKSSGTAVLICPGGGYNILAYKERGIIGQRAATRC
jgi:hypothetical protein